MTFNLHKSILFLHDNMSSPLQKMKVLYLCGERWSEQKWFSHWNIVTYFHRQTISPTHYCSPIHHLSPFSLQSAHYFLFPSQYVFFLLLFLLFNPPWSVSRIHGNRRPWVRPLQCIHFQGWTYFSPNFFLSLYSFAFRLQEGIKKAAIISDFGVWSSTACIEWIHAEI